MHGPGKPDDEKQIKALLASSRPEARAAGLVYLDGLYRNWLSRRLRHWSNNHGYDLTPEDLKDIWRETMEAVVKNVSNGKFRFEGSLEAYLTTIARRKAIDVLRQRAKIRFGFDGDQIPKSSGVHLPTEFEEELQLCYQKLSPKLRFVLCIDVELFFRAGGKWVSLRELTDEINESSGETLSQNAVSNRRLRARKELRKLLGERGYGE